MATFHQVVVRRIDDLEFQVVIVRVHSRPPRRVQSASEDHAFEHRKYEDSTSNSTIQQPYNMCLARCQWLKQQVKKLSVQRVSRVCIQSLPFHRLCAEVMPRTCYTWTTARLSRACLQTK